MAIVLLVCLWVIPLPAESKKTLLNSWSTYTHLVLAQCMIAESDEGVKDHVAIAYAMKNWLELRRRVHPHLRYVDVARSYCSVHKLSLRGLSKRQTWIRQLGFPQDVDGALVFAKPTDFPKTASWERKRKVWHQTLQRAWNWNQRKYRDPCRGKAIGWGAPQDPKSKWFLPSDVPSDNLIRISCKGVTNWFYRFKTKEELTAGEQLAIK